MSDDDYDDEAEGVDETLEEMEEDDGNDGDDPEARTWFRDALVACWSLDHIRSIVEVHPELVECDADGDDDWCSALHYAICVVHDEYEVVRYLAKRNPKALQVKDHNGFLPLHLAVIHRSPLSIVRVLVKMYPQALQETIDDKRWRGHLPLHCSFLNGYTPDFNYIERHGRSDVTAFLIQQHPAAVRTRTANGYLPLHLAFADDDGDPWVEEPGTGDDRAAPIEVIHALLKTWPESISETDPRGRLAIHLACRSSLTPLAVICRLVQEWRASLRRRDVEDGDLPVHHAIESGMPHGVISFLADASPRSVRKPNSHGYLALHLLLTHSRKYSPERLLALVQLMVSHFPASVRRKGGSEDGEEKEGSLPLHIAVHCHAPFWIIRFLVRAHREALLVKSVDGFLPLHMALWKSVSPFVIQFLVEECPQSLQVRKDGRRVALHVAAEVARSVAIVSVVHRARPEALREKTDKGCTPLHLVIMRSFSKSDAAEGLSIVRYFLDQEPSSIEETTLSGALPVHLAARCASPDVVRLIVERESELLLLAQPNNEGHLPLHRAVVREYNPDAALQVVQYLVEKAPGALQVADHRGHLPLHESVSVPGGGRSRDFWDQRRLPVVKHLVAAWPQALDEKDRAGRIPLMVAAESDASLDVLFHMLTSYPQSIGGGGSSSRRHSQVQIRRHSRRQRRSKRPRQV